MKGPERLIAPWKRDERSIALIGNLQVRAAFFCFRTCSNCAFFFLITALYWGIKNIETYIVHIPYKSIRAIGKTVASSYRVIDEQQWVLFVPGPLAHCVWYNDDIICHPIVIFSANSFQRIEVWMGELFGMLRISRIRNTLLQKLCIHRSCLL